LGAWAMRHLPGACVRGAAALPQAARAIARRTRMPPEDQSMESFSRSTIIFSYTTRSRTNAT
ncbi:MAG: hypothetical protein K2X49_01420, partial [Acetobacteraceae bacterium]|nr:hypothetical protein [Acetobacteraceae bacterium]